MTKCENCVTALLRWTKRGDVGLMTSLLTFHFKKGPGEVLEGSGQRRGICNVDKSGMCSQVRYTFTSRVCVHKSCVRSQVSVRSQARCVLTSQVCVDESGVCSQVRCAFTSETCVYKSGVCS